MDQKLFQRLMRLAQKTKDKIVFVDSETGKASVVMSLSAYESLVDRVDLGDDSDDLDDLEFNDREFGSHAQADDDGIWPTPPESAGIDVAPEIEIEKPTSSEFKTSSATASALEEEEKFYLEPLE